MTTGGDGPTEGAGPEVPEVCKSCRFGSGTDRDCILIEDGRFRHLIAEGPCHIDEVLLEDISLQLTRRQRPTAAAGEHRDALVERLGEREEVLGRLDLRRLPEFRVWLSTQVAAFLDEVREDDALVEPEPVAPAAVVEPAPVEAGAPSPPSTAEAPALPEGGRLHCGACRHFKRSGAGACGLEFLGDAATGLEPNPWWGPRIDRDSDPELLIPPCRAFEPRPAGELDPFAGLIAVDRQAPTRRDEAARLVCLALDRLAERDAEGMRAAALLQGSVFGGKSEAELAQDCGISEDGVRLLLDHARAEIAQILEREMPEDGGDSRG